MEMEFDVVVFMFRGISLRKVFWVVNTSRASAPNRFKRLTSNFAHTFLTGCWTKEFPRFFSNNESFIFYFNNSASFESVFCMKTLTGRLFKKCLKRRKSLPRFCLSLGWLHICANKLLKIAILLVQELIKYNK